MLHERVREFVFKVLSTYEVIWRRCQGLESHPTDRMSRESNSEPLVTRRVVYPLHHDGSSKLAYLYCPDSRIYFASINFKSRKSV